MPEPTPVEVIREHLKLVCVYEGPNFDVRCRAALAALASLEAELAEAREALTKASWAHEDWHMHTGEFRMHCATCAALSRHSPAEEPR